MKRGFFGVALVVSTVLPSVSTFAPPSARFAAKNGLIAFAAER